MSKNTLDGFFKPFGQVKINSDLYTQLSSEPLFPFLSIDDKWIAEVITKDKTHYIVSVSTFIKVAQKYVDIDTDKISLKVVIFNGSKEIETILGSEILSIQGVKELLKYGVRFEEKQSERLTRYLMISVQNAQIQNVYSRLGWLESRNL